MNNPVVVISGATGAAAVNAAQAFAAQGASLALISSSQAKLDALAAELALPEARILTAAGDLRSPEDVRAAAERVYAKFGRADVLLHLVGGWTGGKKIAELPADDLENMLSQHVWTTFHLLQAFTPGMLRNGWGRVLIISSPLAVQPSAGMSAYAVGKAAEDALLQTLAQEVKDSGVTANILQVRSIDSTGTGKGTTPDEITAAMLYLCSDVAARVNGARLPLYP